MPVDALKQNSQTVKSSDRMTSGVWLLEPGAPFRILLRGLAGALALVVAGCLITWLIYDRLARAQVRSFQSLQLSAARQIAFSMSEQMDEVRHLLDFLGGISETGSSESMLQKWSACMEGSKAGRELVCCAWIETPSTGGRMSLPPSELATHEPDELEIELKSLKPGESCRVSRPYFIDGEPRLLFLKGYSNGGWAALEIAVPRIGQLLGMSKQVASPGRYFMMDEDGYTLAHSVPEYVGRHFSENFDRIRYPEAFNFLNRARRETEGTGGYPFLAIGVPGRQGTVMTFAAFKDFTVAGSEKRWILAVVAPESMFAATAAESSRYFAGLLVLQALVLFVMLAQVYFSQARMLRQRAKAREAEERSLALSRYRSIFQSFTSPVVLTDRSGGILAMNHRAREILLRGGAAAPLPENIRNVLPADAVAPPESGSAERTSDCILESSGAARLSLRIRVAEVPDIDGLVYQIEDLTRQRQIEQRARLTDRLDVLNEMTASIAHEIRNPLVGVFLGAQMLKQELPPDSPFQDDVADMLTGAGQVEKVVNEMVEFARPQPPGPSWVNPLQLVESALFFISPYARKASVDLETDMEDHLPDVFVDPQQMKQVLVSVCINAVQSMPDGGRLGIKVRGSNGDVVVDVSDTGQGIAEDDRDKVFSPYFTTKAQGTGLGLAICRNICEENGADIGFQSVPGKGTTFSITIHYRSEPEQVE
ncbi:MAG TPA: ATP-binding protein [Candidatus Brocadiia bacterium]|nr:ATP-binding protein [Candidatus Brocadiia bacterium]